MQADQILPSTMPALPYLKALKMLDMELWEFPSSLASSLRQLTSLDLSENLLACLPLALSQVTTLEFLDLSNNGMQLVYSDVDILIALPFLRTLDLSTHQSRHRAKSVRGTPHYLELSRISRCVLGIIKERLPDLDLPGLGAYKATAPV